VAFLFLPSIFYFQLKKEKRNCRSKHPQDGERKKKQGGDALAFYLAFFVVKSIRGRFDAPYNP
jgi:hypothetical protein